MSAEETPLKRFASEVMVSSESKGSEHARQEVTHVPVSALEDLGIEAELIAKVPKEQAVIVARGVGDGLDACPIKPVLGEDRLCGSQNGLARVLCASRALPSRLPDSVILFSSPRLIASITFYVSNYLHNSQLERPCQEEIGAAEDEVFLQKCKEKMQISLILISANHELRMI